MATAAGCSLKPAAAAAVAAIPEKDLLEIRPKRDPWDGGSWPIPMFPGTETTNKRIKKIPDHI